MTARAIDSPPIIPPASANSMPVAMNRASHPRPYTRYAPKLRRQATRLKNRLLAGETPCQWTSAGACQNMRNSGMCSASARMAAPSTCIPGCGSPEISAASRVTSHEATV